MTKYAYYDSTKPAPSPVIGWYDSDGFNAMTLKTLPASNLQELSDAQWAARYPGLWAVQSGALVAYTPPAVVVPLQTQAVTAQAWIQQQANLAAAMGEVFTADMKDYVEAIAAIANGTDTTSTVLPAQPTDVMTAS